MQFANEQKIPIVLGTTGFNHKELKEIDEISKEIPLLIAPNTSMGIALFKNMLDQIKDLLKITPSVEIIEKHHKQKKDMPSGTAINLKEQLEEISSKENIKIISVREGHSAGEHTIKLYFDDEVIEISHQALDRSLFAKGAIIAGKWLKDKKPGSYTMQDIYPS